MVGSIIIDLDVFSIPGYFIPSSRKVTQNVVVDKLLFVPFGVRVRNSLSFQQISKEGLLTPFLVKLATWRIKVELTVRHGRQLLVFSHGSNEVSRVSTVNSDDNKLASLLSRARGNSTL